MPDEFDDAIDLEVWEHARTHRDGRIALARPTVARLIARLYAAANEPLRAKMLAGMLRPLGPLGLVGIATGAFAGFLRRGNNEGLRIALEDVGRYSSDQIYELARFVEQVSPETLQQIARLVADNPVGITAFSVSVAMLLVRSLRGAAPVKTPDHR